MIDAPIIGIQRLRVGRDGHGVTTLVGFHGCPLHCRYCLNPQCHKPECVRRTITPKQLLDIVKIDDIYFKSTGGGICFGGGEPAIYTDFILEFKSICPPQWKITIETSLNVSLDCIKRLIPVIDQWIIGIKDTNEDVYRDYTGKDNAKVISNLKLLAGYSERCVIRIPLIPDINTEADIQESTKIINLLGFTQIDYLTYTTNPKNQKK